MFITQSDKALQHDRYGPIYLKIVRFADFFYRNLLFFSKEVSHVQCGLRFVGFRRGGKTDIPVCLFRLFELDKLKDRQDCLSYRLWVASAAATLFSNV